MGAVELMQTHSLKKIFCTSLNNCKSKTPLNLYNILTLLFNEDRVLMTLILKKACREKQIAP